MIIFSETVTIVVISPNPLCLPPHTEYRLPNTDYRLPNNFFLLPLFFAFFASFAVKKP